MANKLQSTTYHKHGLTGQSKHLLRQHLAIKPPSKALMTTGRQAISKNKKKQFTLRDNTSSSFAALNRLGWGFMCANIAAIVDVRAFFKYFHVYQAFLMAWWNSNYIQ